MKKNYSFQLILFCCCCELNKCLFLWLTLKCSLHIQLKLSDSINNLNFCILQEKTRKFYIYSFLAHISLKGSRYQVPKVFRCPRYSDTLGIQVPKVLKCQRYPSAKGSQVLNVSKCPRYLGALGIQVPKDSVALSTQVPNVYRVEA